MLKGKITTILLTVFGTSLVFFLVLPKESCWNLKNLDGLFQNVSGIIIGFLNVTLPRLFETFGWSTLVLIIMLPPFQKNAINMIQIIGGVSKEIIKNFHPNAKEIHSLVENQTPEEKEIKENEEKDEENEALKRQEKERIKNIFNRKIELRREILKEIKQRYSNQVSFQIDSKVIFSNDPVVDTVTILSDATYNDQDNLIIIEIKFYPYFRMMDDRIYKYIRVIQDYNKSQKQKASLLLILAKDNKEDSKYIDRFIKNFQPAIQDGTLKVEFYDVSNHLSNLF